MVNFKYVFALSGLLLRREISIATWCYAVIHRPLVVAGKRQAWVVETIGFEDDVAASRFAVLQFILGAVMVAGAVAWSIAAIQEQGFYAAALVTVLRAGLVMGVGLVAMLYAAVSLHPEPTRRRI